MTAPNTVNPMAASGTPSSSEQRGAARLAGRGTGTGRLPAERLWLARTPQQPTPQLVGMNITADARSQKLPTDTLLSSRNGRCQARPTRRSKRGVGAGTANLKLRGNPGWRWGHRCSGEHTGNAWDLLISRTPTVRVLLPVLHIFSGIVHLHLGGQLRLDNLNYDNLVIPNAPQFVMAPG